MTAILEREQVANAYGRYGRRSEMMSARYSAAAGLCEFYAGERIGGRILEVGVGTGLSLRSYSSGSHIVGSTSRADARQGNVSCGVRALATSSIAVGDAENTSFRPPPLMSSFSAICRDGVAIGTGARATVRPGGPPGWRNRHYHHSHWHRNRPARNDQEMADARHQPTRLACEFAWSRYERWTQGAPGVRLLARRAPHFARTFALIRFLKLRKLLEYDATAPAKTLLVGS